MQADWWKSNSFGIDPFVWEALVRAKSHGDFQAILDALDEQDIDKHWDAILIELDLCDWGRCGAESVEEAKVRQNALQSELKRYDRIF